MGTNSKRVFLVDGIGAIITTTLLLTVLVPFAPAFGLPPKALFILAAIAAGFAVYSLTCFVTLKTDHRPFLKVIAFMNLGYCFITALLIFMFFDSVTLLGIAYLTVEIILVSTLAIYELITAGRAAGR